MQIYFIGNQHLLRVFYWPPFPQVSKLTLNKKKLHVLKMNQAAFATLGDHWLLLAAQVGCLPSKILTMSSISHLCSISISSGWHQQHQQYLLFPSGWLTLLTKTLSSFLILSASAVLNCKCCIRFSDILCSPVVG